VTEDVRIVNETNGPAAREQSVGELVSGLSKDLTTLVRQELELARAEMTEKAKAGGRGAGRLGAGAVAALAFVGSLTAFAVILLDLWMPTWAAALIVTAFWAIVAGALALSGRAQLRSVGTPVPEQTMETTKEDVQWLKNRASSAKR
jgi:hypothetical protein